LLRGVSSSIEEFKSRWKARRSFFFVPGVREGGVEGMSGVISDGGVQGRKEGEKNMKVFFLLIESNI
jgi:hypothetical protein